MIKTVLRYPFARWYLSLHGEDDTQSHTPKSKHPVCWNDTHAHRDCQAHTHTDQAHSPSTQSTHTVQAHSPSAQSTGTVHRHSPSAQSKYTITHTVQAHSPRTQSSHRVLQDNSLYPSVTESLCASLFSVGSPTDIYMQDGCGSFYMMVNHRLIALIENGSL